MLAQANRTTARYPTRSIDYPTNPTYGSPVYGYTAQNTTWNAPVTLTPPPPPTAAQYTARQTATAPIVPIVSQTTAPSYPPVYAGTGTPIPPASGPAMMPYQAPSMPPPTYAGPAVPNGYAYPQAGYPQAGYASNGYPAAGYPPMNYGVPSYGYPANAYAAWYARQGTLFPTTLFGATAGQSSLVSGGYPYTGYPPGAVPSATSTYGQPRVATNPMGVSSNAPNYWGRTTLPFATGSY